MFNKFKEHASRAAEGATSFGQEAGKRMSTMAEQSGVNKVSVNSPIIGSLSEESAKASRILEQFINKEEIEHGFDSIIPVSVIKKAKGLVIFTVVKAGFLWSGRAGSGLLVARLPNGQWSAPSAIATGGVGFGAQVGADITDVVLILNTDDAVKAFAKGGNVTIGGNLAVSAGPIGAGGEAAVATASGREVAPIFSYTKSKGLFAGMSIEGTVLLELGKVNTKFYGHPIKASELIQTAPPNEEAAPLYAMIKRAEDRDPY